MALLPQRGPLRVYALVTSVDSTGFGLRSTGSVLFLTQILDLSPALVGIAPTAAADVGLLAAIPGGRLFDLLAVSALPGIVIAIAALLGAVIALTAGERLSSAVHWGTS